MAFCILKRNCNNPVLNIFTVSDDFLKDKIFTKPNKNWALFVMNNRKIKPTEEEIRNSNHDNKYDIVIGPIANDSMVLLFRDFERGRISLKQLIKEMKYKEYIIQYSFHTEKAIILLKKENSEWL